MLNYVTRYLLWMSIVGHVSRATNAVDELVVMP